MKRLKNAHLKTMMKTGFAAAAIAALAASLVLVVAVTQSPSAKAGPPRFSELSDLGSGPVPLTAADARALRHFDRSGASLQETSMIASRNGRSYFRITNRTGAACYAVGPAAAAAFRLGQIQCAPDFPSAQRPVLDFTVIRQSTNDSASARVWQSEGIAADGVASVAFITDTSDVVDVTNVEDNVYSVATPPGVHVVRLIARDASGSVVWSEPLTAPAAP